MKKITYYLKFVVLVFLVIAGTTAFGTKFRVAVQSFQFVPKNLPDVKPGDTIHWYWFSGSHTTTSDTIPNGAPSWSNPINVTDTAFEYVVTNTGTYKYHCNFHVLMGMVGSFTVTPVGVNEIPPPANVSVYPNPVYDNLKIHIESQELYIKHLWIFDLDGRIIDERTFVTSPGIEDKTINLAEIPQGVLILEFLDNNNNKYVRKVIKR